MNRCLLQVPNFTCAALTWIGATRRLLVYVRLIALAGRLLGWLLLPEFPRSCRSCFSQERATNPDFLFTLHSTLITTYLHSSLFPFHIVKSLRLFCCLYRLHLVVRSSKQGNAALSDARCTISFVSSLSWSYPSCGVEL